LLELLPILDAANIDLKSMDDAFYRTICKASLEPVLRTIGLCHEHGVHLEVTNLVIPGHNDSDDHFQRLTDFLAGIDRTIPLHLSAYRPCYQFSAPATPAATLRRAAQIASQKLDHVFVGNLHLDKFSNTVCHNCQQTLIERTVYFTRSHLTDTGTCSNCGANQPVVIS